MNQSNESNETRKYRVHCESCNCMTTGTRNPETFATTCDKCGTEINIVSSYGRCPHNPVHAWNERGECIKQTATERAGKSTRQREVFPTHEIPHLWAHKVCASGRNPGRNLYFGGDTIYSYGSHFPIARHVTNGRKAAILFTTRTYSVTTTRHLSMVRSAIPDSVQVFNVPEVLDSWYGYKEREIDHAKNVASYIKIVAYTLAEAVRARSASNKQWKHEEAVKVRAEYLAYLKFFNLGKSKIDPIPALDSAQMEKLRKREAAKSAEKAKAERERKERLAAEFAEDVIKWRKGEISYLNHAYAHPPALRIVGDEVETSRGARFPVSHAKRGLALVRAVVARGEAWQTNGHTLHLGHYKIDRIDADGTVTCGCHVVSYEEVQRLAPQIDAWKEHESK